jgi:uncharacterized membrane protein
MALAVITVGVVSLFIPDEFRLTQGSAVVYPVELAILLGVLVIGDPGRIDRDKRWLRIVTGTMIAWITIVTVVSAVRLILGILQKADFATPGQLLTLGGIVWITNVIACALWYWHLDRGGPAARASGRVVMAPAFRFPEEEIPALADAGWYPQFVDYLALSYNTSTAFSTADTSPIRHWSKMMLILESAVSLVLVILVVARAVNVL